jgi:hypothetical protein
MAAEKHFLWLETDDWPFISIESASCLRLGLSDHLGHKASLSGCRRSCGSEAQCIDRDRGAWSLLYLCCIFTDRTTKPCRKSSRTRLWLMDLGAIRTFNQQCSDFFVLQNGTPPGEIQAEEVFKEVTPGRGIEDKLPIGIFDSDGTLVSPD